MGSGKGVEGNSPADGVFANSSEAVEPWGGCLGLRSIPIGDILLEAPA